MSDYHKAMLWEPADQGAVQCKLCGQACTISPGQYGICRVRLNENGSLVTTNYDSVVAMHVDPIEKKPLFHFLPGSQSLSIAAAGCNFQCEFCQNWQISQAPRQDSEPIGQAIAPEQIVAAAVGHDCASISYTYTEPTVFFELAYETARLAHPAGLRNCFVSNGFMTPQAVDTIAPYLDAINVDLKAFDDDTYRRVMKASLAPVLECLEAIVAAGIWLEVTTLVVPGMNDSPDELSRIADYITANLGTHVPWHISRFHGDYKMNTAPATPMSTLDMARSIAQAAGLKYVYCGNTPGSHGQSTFCPACGGMLIERVGYEVGGLNLPSGACAKCGEQIDGIWGL
ncbi:MAG: AmmeMemoRadiSam system radical SAM enzyme [Phycisphaerales bacterium]|jgi:pyruvate formate lyase activating enzyme|nr:AmmeMemoRadiSam system radical SAM enzyme [Phycisphaerales bacterium]